MPTIRHLRLRHISFFFLAAMALFVLAACGIQNSIVYQPQAYPFPRTAIPSQVRELDFRTSEGAQQAYYVAPRSGKMESLWIMFPGNAGTALGWYAWVKQYPDANAGFLLIDYPGYGNCEGHPSAKAILESNEAAFAVLAASLHIDQAQLWSRTSVLGHSLGAAASLQFAVKHTPQQVVLVSPFTSLQAIGEQKVGSVLGSVINNEYDSVARLKELEGRPVRVHIVHGTDDEVIPVAFGRELARAAPGISYAEVPGAHHNDILYTGRAAIYRAMGQNGVAD